MSTILLVLESEPFRYALTDELKSHFQIIAAEDAASGAAMLQARPEILLLDLLLPETDGFRFLEDNFELLPPTIVLFTRLTNPQILQTASDLGVSAMYMMPCSILAVRKYLQGQP